MSKTKRNVFLIALSLILVAMCGLSLFMLNNSASVYGNLVFEDASFVLAEKYTYGDELTIPGKATINVGDDSYQSTNAILIAPDGTVQNAGQNFTLDQVGYYTARYYYKVGDVVKYEEQKFMVANLKYQTSSSNTYAEYIADLNDTANTNSYGFVEYASMTSNDQVEGGDVINDGIRLHLNDSDTFTYAKPVKLNTAGLTNIATFTSVIPYDSEPIPLTDDNGDPCFNEDGTPQYLYDLYELTENPEKYFEYNEGTLVKATDLGLGENVYGKTWNNKVFREDIEIPLMYDYDEYNDKTSFSGYVRFTDAYDPNNYVEVKVGYGRDGGQYHADIDFYRYYNTISATFNNNSFYAMINKDLTGGDSQWRKNVTFQGHTYELHVTSANDVWEYRRWGVWQQNRQNQLVEYSATKDEDGNYLEGEGPYRYTDADGNKVYRDGESWSEKGELLFSQKKMYYSFYYDYTTQDVYFQVNGLKATSLSFITNLTCDGAYGEAFGGFSSDEVMISFRADGFSGNQVAMDVVDIGGHNLTSDDANSWARAFQTEGTDPDGNDVTLRYEDVAAPSLTIDYTPSYAGKVYAAVNAEFPIFNAVARDVNLKEVTSEVYYNYVDESNKGTLVYSDGKTFTPTKAGPYTIVYRAIDTFENVAIETVDVLCVKTDNDSLITIDITQADFDALTAKGGEVVNLPTANILGLNGEVSSKVKAVYLATGEEFEIENNAFVPLYVGSFKIVYELADAITNLTYEYNLSVGSSNSVGYSGSPALPKYLIAGAKYSFEDLDFYTFTSAEGRTETTYSLFISYDDGATWEAYNGQAIAEGKTSALIKYKSGETEVISAPITIKDVGYGKNANNTTQGTPGYWDIKSYFVTNDTNIIATKDSSVFQATKTSGTASFDFIKEVSVSNFKLEMKAYNDLADTAENEATGNNFESFNVILTDYYDPSIQVEIKLVNIDANTTQLVVNGVASLSNNTSILSESNSTLRYSTSNNAFYLGNEAAVEIKVLCDLPFTSDKVYVSFEIEGITGEAGIAISTLVNQKLGVLKRDNVTPMISLVYNRGNKAKGDIFQINSPDVIDVLSPILDSDVMVKVESPTGSTVTTLDGINISNDVIANRVYEFELSEYGDYFIKFTYKDQLATTTIEYNVAITVLEKVPPVVEFTDGTKVGTTIDVPVGRPVTLKGATVTDNLDPNPRLIVVVQDKFLTLKVISVDEAGNRTFTPLVKGIYKIMYRASDATGNTSIYYYYVNAQ